MDHPDLENLEVMATVQWVVLCCIVLYCIVLYCIVLPCHTVLCYRAVVYVLSWCIMLLRCHNVLFSFYRVVLCGVCVLITVYMRRLRSGK